MTQRLGVRKAKQQLMVFEGPSKTWDFEAASDEIGSDGDRSADALRSFVGVENLFDETQLVGTDAARLRAVSENLLELIDQQENRLIGTGEQARRDTDAVTVHRSVRLLDDVQAVAVDRDVADGHGFTWPSRRATAAPSY